MSNASFNKKNISTIKDIGLQSLISAIFTMKGVAGIKLIQRAINSLGGNIYIDGWLGRKSISALESYGSELVHGAIVYELSQLDKTDSHKLSKTSLKRLKGVHPDIIKVVKRASLYAPIFVVEGMRSQKRQNKLKRKGKSQISKSYHLYGLAVDLVLLKNGKIDWNSKASYKKIHKAIGRAEDELGLQVLDNAMFDLHWTTLTDYPHWQMSSRYVPTRNPRKYYAKNKGTGFA